MSDSDSFQPTFEVRGLGACGTGFASARVLASAVGCGEEIAIVSGRAEAAPEALNTLDAWVIAAVSGALNAAGGLASFSAERVGLLYLSTWGCTAETMAYLDSMFCDAGQYASPRRFTRSVYSSVGSAAAIDVGIHGCCETLSAIDLPIMRVLERAWCLLEAQRLDVAICCWADQVEPLTVDLCRRAARELGRDDLKRYDRPGGGSVAVALGRCDGSIGSAMRLQGSLLAAAPAESENLPPWPGAKSGVRWSDDDGTTPHTDRAHLGVPALAAYPTDAALNLAAAIIRAAGGGSPAYWLERAPRGGPVWRHTIQPANISKKR